MTTKKYQKPNWIPSAYVKATNDGWVNTNNNDEVLIAIPRLVARLAREDDSTTIPNAPSLTIVNSGFITLKGLPLALYTIDYGEEDTINGLFDSQGSASVVLTLDLSVGDMITVTQVDPDENSSLPGTYIVKKLKGVIDALVPAVSTYLSITGHATNIAVGTSVTLSLGEELLGTENVTAGIDGIHAFAFSNITSGVPLTAATLTISATDVGGKVVIATIVSDVPTGA